MPSDARITQILEQLAPQRDQFRSAVAAAAEQLRSTLSDYRSASGDHVERAAFELGRFARGRIDAALFAQVFGHDSALDQVTVEWIDRAEAVLQEIASTTHLHQYVRAEPGASLSAAVERALARIGRGFGAARVAEYARAGHPIRVEAQFLEAFPFALWNRAERRIALPLVVEVDGSDLRVGGLEEFLDGGQIIVLLVNGNSPPAALVRLITPNVLVMQTAQLEDVGKVAAAGGPAICALVPESCAQFVYDRSSLVVSQTPAPARIAAIGRIGIFQQREELLQLDRLNTGRPVDIARAESAAEPQPEDVLAAWLLRQADLTQTG
jgi:hypothetical protein